MLRVIISMGGKFITGIYHINYTVWVRIFNGNIWLGMVFKKIEYMNGGCFENLSGTSVPNS